MEIRTLPKKHINKVKGRYPLADKGTSKNTICIRCGQSVYALGTAMTNEVSYLYKWLAN